MEPKLPYCQKPCSNCPFRTDSLEGWLGAARAEEISSTDSFVCHKNTKLQCGGFLAFKRKTDNNAAWFRVAYVLGVKINTDGSKVFNSQQEMIKHHGRKNYKGEITN